VTNIFPRMTVFENIRCGVLWALGYRYSFWTCAPTPRATPPRGTEQVLEQLNLTRRASCRPACFSICRSSARWRSASPSPAAPT
jgi:hypothetical protein